MLKDLFARSIGERVGIYFHDSNREFVMVEIVEAYEEYLVGKFHQGGRLAGEGISLEYVPYSAIQRISF
jgi:hypothetical protein